jgi:fructokinase
MTTDHPMTKKIICFGEILWDMLPTGKMPGGAPVNVAIHLKYHGFLPVIISRVGVDAPGAGLLDYVSEKGLSTQWIQTDGTYPTGIVKANISNKTEVTYQIVQPVAWDYIAFDNTVASAVAGSDVFVFGSLAARNEITRNTLLQYLNIARLKVFDVNLRPPHYTPERIEQLLQTASIVKMNHHELEEIMVWHDKATDEQQGMAYLKNYYHLEMVIVTRGEKGAAVLANEGYFEHAGYQVKVEDTIGSGDSFLAAFLSNYLHHQAIPVCLEKACLVGAFVATRKGATPEYDPATIAL